jgi:transmembrane sensor
MGSTPRLPVTDDVETNVGADFESLEQAATWYAALHAEGEGGPQHKAWGEWLAASPQHRRAWAHVESVSRRFEPLRAHGEGEREAAVAAARVAAKQAAGRRRALACLAALGGTGLTAWLTWQFTPMSDLVMAWRADYHTRVGEQRDVVLADGTRVWINTDSALDVDYDDTRRLLTLKAGEILVDTGADPRARPFYVDTRHGRMQALGTRFTVRQTASFTELAVFEGLVEIRTRSGMTERVSAGKQRSFTGDTISSAAAADPAREAWSRGVILADDISLAALINELGRYQRGHIGVDPRVANIRVVGRFPTGNPEQVLAMLARDLPVSIRRTLPWWTTVEPR